MGVYLLISLNRTDIFKDAALELFVFRFSSVLLSWSVTFLPFLKSLSPGMSFVLSGSPLSTPLSAFRPCPCMAPDKAFFLWLSVFLVVVDLASQLDILCKYCHSQDGPCLPCISPLSHSFVHLSLIDYLISLLSRVLQLYLFGLF